MRPPVVAVGIATAVLLAATACGGGDGGGDDGAVLVPTTAVEAGPPTSAGPPAVLAIVSPATGAVVAGNVVRLDLTSSGITIVPADGGTGSRRGHYHVFIDREPVDSGAVIPVAADIIHTADDPIVIPGLTVGSHRISVIFGDGTHRRIGLNEASTSFTVAGPAIDASAPPNVSAGQPVVLTVVVEGLTFPEDGRLYVLVDAEPPAVGEILPDTVLQSSETTIAVPDLVPGTHTLWVLAGSEGRVPLDPPVMDKVMVTVG